MAVKSYDELVQDRTTFRNQHNTDLSDSESAAKQAVIDGKENLIQQRDDARADQLTRAQTQAGDPQPEDNQILAALKNDAGIIDCRYLSQNEAEIVVRNLPQPLQFAHYAQAITLGEEPIEFDEDAMQALETEYDNIRKLNKV